MVKDVMNIAVVSYQPSWGDKEKNLNRIAGYAECAARRGAHLVLMPEVALSGYDVVDEGEGECMHHRLAEPIPGPATETLGALTRELGIYLVFGMPERAEDGAVYNSAVVLDDQGNVAAKYRKMHLPGLEATWAERGSEPCVFDTPWGKVGLAICYDTFAFTEIMRYERALGCRLHLNPAAADSYVTGDNIRTCVEYQAANNSMFVASANCTGFHSANDFVGGANVVGPAKNCPEVRYYAGVPFGSPRSDEQELYLGTIDLSYAAKPSCTSHQWEGEPRDFRPDVYAKMYAHLAELE